MVERLISLPVRFADMLNRHATNRSFFKINFFGIYVRTEIKSYFKECLDRLPS